MSSTEHLVRLGLNVNEAKALDALMALGPSGAADVHRYSGMPRNKAYESLERLASRGVIEVQHGRPVLYRASEAKSVIENLTESYGREAKEALKSLEERQEAGMGESLEPQGETTYTWMVKGEQAVKRRLAELIYEAKEDVFGIGGYPPKYLLSAKTALKAASKRGVTVRPISMIRPTQEVAEISNEDKSVIEFRTVKSSPTLRVRIQPYDEQIINGFVSTQGSGSMVIVDQTLAFDIIDDGVDPKRVTGILMKVPGIPRIQKATVERILALYTRKL
ncbi:MAG TPA: helix-turn-helix domain-containing protein [Nitrososphaerales archaeon]|nr:helix-turn-helix domain-containing protein [Nitrososphaerales archaeon]